MHQLHWVKNFSSFFLRGSRAMSYMTLKTQLLNFQNLKIKGYISN